MRRKKIATETRLPNQQNPAAALPISDVVGSERTGFSGLHLPVLLTFGLFAAAVTIAALGSSDYVGRDNDDVMRLVQVRDFLAGQGWFDLLQPRLGLEGGTLMHWSRLIDLPIALLIGFFGLFFEGRTAEALALHIWPVLTALPLFYAMAIGGRAVAGARYGTLSAVFALVATFLFAFSVSRFRPGAIDHHNVQLVLIAIIAAALVQPGRPAGAYAIAGMAAALAIAIGAETTPHVAVACGLVALIWLFQPRQSAAGAAAFSLSFAVMLTAAFYLTVPPSRYDVVVCDALSTGFYVLGALGAGGLFLAVATLSGRGLAARAAGLAAVAAVTAAAAIVVAPQCLASPLASLDPMLVDMWLDSVGEAQPVWRKFARDPWTAGGFYFVPLVAAAVAVFNIRRGRSVEAHLILLALMGVSFAIALIQVRGSVFSNLLSILILAPVVAELRMRANRDPKNAGKSLVFVLSALISLPVVWIFVGASASLAYDRLTGRPAEALADTDEKPVCNDSAALAPLAAEPVGVVAGPSNLGAAILRFTSHRALAAPYHRNQGGMLTELRIGLADPVDAHELIRTSGVTLIAFCRSDPQLRSVIEKAPGGLYAAIAAGRVPNWLEPVPETSGRPLEIYRVRR